MTWFESDLIRLRSAEAADVDALLGYLNHSDVYEDRQFGRSEAWPLTHSEVAEQIGENSATERTFVIEAGGQIVGHVCADWWWDVLQPWCGVVVDPAHRRRGYGRAAAGTIVGYLFERTPAHVVTAEVGEWNTPGIHFAKSLGFSTAGRYRHSVRRNGRWHDTVTFDLLRREWEAQHAAGG